MGPDFGFRYSKVKTLKNQLSGRKEKSRNRETVWGGCGRVPRQIAGFANFQTKNSSTPLKIRLFISKY